MLKSSIISTWVLSITICGPASSANLSIDWQSVRSADTQRLLRFIAINSNRRLPRGFWHNRARSS
ncbi:hypothetical protein DERF_006988 [Dermatophagoides farinae]|uniref:Secreted protein n=1 Tax=Dermatophagoides farinae TaxID=6954 RepID=A0A922HX09_DERFA|nr:hypothetical protein DERF_006988 [Dermatophagoides farinae]